MTKRLASGLNVSIEAANNAAQQLVGAGILKEKTGHKRNSPLPKYSPHYARARSDLPQRRVKFR